MAYYSGTASNLSDLRNALITHAQADGWVLTGDVLSKAGVFFQIQTTATNITCLGCESNAVANPAPNVVSIGRIWERSGFNTWGITFPCVYEVFGFSQELYLIVNYNVDTYQWMAFGKSTVPGLPGQGGWCGATIGELAVAYSGVFPVNIGIVTGAFGAETNFGFKQTTAALFWNTDSVNFEAHQLNCWVNHGLDSHGWTYTGSQYSKPIGIRHSHTLIALQPNTWNSEATLLPLRCFKERPAFKASLIADLVNARHVRIDNFTPGDILTIGPERWKVFPWYRKDSASRNGGMDINHTGTFGWAIRYEGP